MKKYIYGTDTADPAAAAVKLKNHGYDSIILSAGDPDIFKACADAGLEAYLCFGAHTIGGFDKEKYTAVSAVNEPAPWFGSACPNAAEVSAHNQDAAFEFADSTPEIKGIFVDGARFASFASNEGIDSFFSCFCPRCMEKLDSLGYNALTLKAGISVVKSYLEGGKGEIRLMRAALESWFSFRSACVKEYMELFAMRAKMAGLRSGAFVFAPSLWWYVGQTPDALSSLDIVAPMLYRDYPHESGPATLNHEWKAFYQLCSHTGNAPETVLAQLFDTKVPENDGFAFPPEHVGFETEAARAMLNGKFLAPIIQTEDTLLDEVTDRCFSAGADAVGEFMYSQKRF